MVHAVHTLNGACVRIAGQAETRAEQGGAGRWTSRLASGHAPLRPPRGGPADDGRPGPTRGPDRRRGTARGGAPAERGDAAAAAGVADPARAQSNIDAVHTGDWWAAAKSGRCRPATREQALDALRRQTPACVHCRPDTALGILD
ncbi:DUF6233 domain-containing protein [Streptomyces collinus]|uniref:DUF6233 domain-containing protein n=1 Tax=Streptomyces collinus TaxID=42684 RepID=UPI0036CE7F54